MKRFYVAAGALLLGTSALAYGGSVDKTDVDPTYASADAKVATSTDKSISAGDALHSDFDKARMTVWNKTLSTTKDLSATDSSKFEYASYDKTIVDQSSGAKLMSASAESGWKDANTDKSADLPNVDNGKVVLASADDWSDSKVSTASSDKVALGMGGPLDDGTVTAADLTPRPATDNYPPCRPGPGDDNCIQLYERGVRAQLASWNRPTGGLADGSASTAMGGPYEPVESDADLAMNGDVSTDASKANSDETDTQTASADSFAHVADHSAHQGVGGPIEAQSGYPPCEPGPGDDRCIQLYEPGVTGAGN